MNYFQQIVTFLCLFLTWQYLNAADVAQHLPRTADSTKQLIEEERFSEAFQLGESMLGALKSADSLYLFLDFTKTVGTQFRKGGRSDLADDFFTKATPAMLWRIPDTDREKSKAGWLYVQFGFNRYTELGDYQGARTAYELALKSLPKEEQNGYQTAKFIYKALGNIYTRLGEYFAGEAMLNDFIQTVRSVEDHERAARGYSDLGLLYTNWGKYPEAEAAYNDGLRLVDVPVSENTHLLVNLSDLFFKQNKVSAAEKQIASALSLMLKESEKATPHFKLHFLFAHIYSKKYALYLEGGHFAQAEQALKKEFEHLNLYYPSSQRREFAKHYLRVAELKFRKKNYPQALTQFQLALQSVLYDYQPTDPYDLPTAEACYAENTIMEALDGMAQLYQAWYDQDGEAFYLKQALACYERVYAVEQALQRSYLYDNSKLFNLEESRQRSEEAIRVANLLFQTTQDNALLYQAFVFAERSRSSLLRAAFRATQAATNAGISQEEINEERAHQRAVAQAEEALFRLREEESIADTLVQAAEQVLLTAQEEMRTWLQALEARHPRYYQLKYADETPQLADVQAMLTTEEVLLEYFVGEKTIFVFRIDRRGIVLHELDKPDQLETRVRAWRASIDGYQQAGADRTRLVSAYQSEGYRLYQDLVEPVLDDTGGKALLLVTSGILDILPFEALLTGPTEQATAFNDYPYLLRNHSISYTYAAGLHWSLYQLERHRGEPGGFAPRFDGSHGWPELSCTTDLLETTIGSAADRLFVAKEATIEQLQANAPRFNLLHLATHAQANAEQGDFSFIVFSDGVGGYDSLFAKDLYLYDLETELVILSACETALGTLYNSEGVISLARAFHYAGARSVVNTLWRINENANCDLLEGFYAALHDGQDKRSALQTAKLSYLERADPRSAHPVYWAGFQLLGNPRPLAAEGNWYWWGLGILLFGGGLCYMFWVRKSKGQRS